MPANGGLAWSALEPAPVVAVWWDAAGARLHTLRADGRLMTREAGSGRVIGEPVPLDERAIAAIPDRTGRLALIGGTSGARLWDAVVGKAAGPLIPCPLPIRDVALSGDGTRAAVLVEGQALLCDPFTGVIRRTVLHIGAVRCVFAPDGARFATISDTSVQLWNAETGQSIATLEPGGSWRKASARFDSTGGRLAVWWADPVKQPTHVRLIDGASGRDLLEPIQQPCAVTDVIFSPAGDVLFIATLNQRLAPWRTGDGHPVRAPSVIPDGIQAIGLSPDGLLLWSRTQRRVHLWETSTSDAAAPPLNHLGPPPAAPRRTSRGAVDTRDTEQVLVAWSTDARLATCDTRGGLNVWDLHAGARSIEQMETLSRVLSMHRLDPNGSLIPLTRDELRQAWQAWRADQPVGGN
jgi:WD40 repeat protein